MSTTFSRRAALGIDGSYMRGMAAAGYGALSIDDLSSSEGRRSDIRTRSQRYRRANRGLPSVETLVGAKASGLSPEDLDPRRSGMSPRCLS